MLIGTQTLPEKYGRRIFIQISNLMSTLTTLNVRLGSSVDIGVKAIVLGQGVRELSFLTQGCLAENGFEACEAYARVFIVSGRVILRTPEEK